MDLISPFSARSTLSAVNSRLACAAELVFWCLEPGALPASPGAAEAAVLPAALGTEEGMQGWLGWMRNISGDVTVVFFPFAFSSEATSSLRHQSRDHQKWWAAERELGKPCVCKWWSQVSDPVCSEQGRTHVGGTVFFNPELLQCCHVGCQLAGIDGVGCMQWITVLSICIISDKGMLLSRPLSLVGFIFKSFDCHTCWNNPLFLLSVFWLLLQLYEVLSVSTRSAVIEVQLCVEYIVQIRCRALDGLGFWSNWSRSAYAAVRDIQGRCACRVCSGGLSSFRLRCDAVLSKL